MARPKKAGRELKSIEECAAAMGELLIAQTDLEAATANRDREVAVVQKRYELDLDNARFRAAEAEEALKTYYYEHLGELEKDGAKHFQLANGVIGRRDGPVRLTTKNRAWTWAAVMARLREKFGDRFLRLREPEIDKDRVKAELDEAQLGELGMRLDRDEFFYAEPARLPSGGGQGPGAGGQG